MNRATFARSLSLVLLALISLAIPPGTSRPAVTRLVPRGIPAREAGGASRQTTRPAVVPVTLWAGPGGAVAYTRPAWDAGALASIPPNQPLEVAPTLSGWGRILLWNALPAYVPLASLSAHPLPPPPPAVDLSAQIPYAGAHAPMSLHARSYTRRSVALQALPAAGSARLALLPAGTRLVIDAWATDASDAAWYHVAAGHTRVGWVDGDAVTFTTGAAASPPAILDRLRGTGMWFTYSLLETSPIVAVIAAARAARLTHLYVEVGSSTAGFYGAPGLAALLPAAHRAGLRVIAWVYPYLHDLPDDIALTLDAASYRAPTGDRPDGVMADVEETMDENAVRAYGQVLRADLGPRALMAIATFPPQSEPGRTYPFATAALSWNVIVPMDYWHLQRRPYTPAEVAAYVSGSVALIHARTRRSEPVEVLGQMFDIFGSGLESPGADEITACAAAAHAMHALGLSFFEWQHATAPEWQALRRAWRVAGTPRR